MIGCSSGRSAAFGQTLHFAPPDPSFPAKLPVSRRYLHRIAGLFLEIHHLFTLVSYN
jgi:hypothetical protein